MAGHPVPHAAVRRAGRIATFCMCPLSTARTRLSSAQTASASTALQEKGKVLQPIQLVHSFPDLPPRRLEATHAQHMLVYGTGNTARMLCPGPAAALSRFSAGVEATGASVRVPHSALLQQRGYYEDRRPAGNMVSL